MSLSYDYYKTFYYVAKYRSLSKASAIWRPSWAAPCSSAPAGG